MEPVKRSDVESINKDLDNYTTSIFREKFRSSAVVSPQLNQSDKTYDIFSGMDKIELNSCIIHYF